MQMSKKREQIELPDTPFWRSYRGRLIGLLREPDMTAMFDTLKAAPEGWYVFDPQETPSQSPLEGKDFLDRLDGIQSQADDWLGDGRLGFIYADDKQNPTFIKIFDPANMGSSCGCSGEMIWPRWILSQIAPEAVPRTPEPTGLMARVRQYFANQA